MGVSQPYSYRVSGLRMRILEKIGAFYPLGLFLIFCRPESAYLNKIELRNSEIEM